MAALLLILPILGVVLLNLPLGRPSARFALWVPVVLALLQLAAVLFAPVIFPLTGPLAMNYRMVGSDLSMDGLTRVMGIAIALVVFASSLVARHAATFDEARAFRFVNLLLLAMAGMNGVVLVRDLFALYVFIEVTSVACFVLIVVNGRRAAFEGAFKYLVLSAVATALLLGGLALIFMVAGATSFGAAAAAVRDTSTNFLALAAVALFLGGLAIKAGLVPFHGWLPDAYGTANGPVSVLLAGIVTKTTGVYALLRLVDAVFGYTAPVRHVLLGAGLLSVGVGALAALGQRDLKRMLAYSSVSQVGYIVLGLAAGPGLGFAGAVLHLFNHAVFKSLLFVNSAAVKRQTGTVEMDRLGGIAARMPVTGVTSVVGMLSTAGIPPFSGFWSKLLIVLALWRAGLPWAAALAVGASVLTLAYFLGMQRRVFFGKPSPACDGLREVEPWALAPAVLLAALTLGLGLAMPWLFDTFFLPVGRIL